ncbi:hypothetical protein E5676_scaffold165G00410 [Cucumis melo var. makuwa]|uniref:Uncharacterized protein n=1 Tax=Cucumis melo var. makuwa TaxID=1194695 RepID=A0A5D3DYL8_CUCMM|nr:hypothetical protein E5676_scaffold165G00410 [Cucumis melo var. makuwa]
MKLKLTFDPPFLIHYLTLLLEVRYLEVKGLPFILLLVGQPIQLKRAVHLPTNSLIADKMTRLDTSQPTSHEFFGISTSVSQIISRPHGSRILPSLRLGIHLNQSLTSFLGYPSSFHKSFLASRAWDSPLT